MTLFKMKKVKKAQISLLIIVLGVVSMQVLQSFSGYPPIGQTGAPGETTCAKSSCHDDSAVNSGPGGIAVNFNGGDSVIFVDSTYDVTITVTDAMTKYGFELVVLNGNGDQAGDLIVTTPSFMDEELDGSKEYLRQKSATSKNSWDFQWRSPSSFGNGITIYAVGLAANSDQDITGDYVYTTSLALNESVMGMKVSGERTSQDFHVYPNPADSKTWNIQMSKDKAKDVQLQVFDISGKIMDHRTSSQKDVLKCTFDQPLSPGIYLINVIGKGRSRSSTVIVN